MAESGAGITTGTDLYFHTWTHTVSGNTRHDQIVKIGRAFEATYSAITASTSIATSADHMFVLQADADSDVWLDRVVIWQSVNAGSAARGDFALYRVSTAGTGGTTVTARPLDAADTDPFGGSAFTLPSSKGTEGNLLWRSVLNVVAAVPNADPIDTSHDPTWKALVIPNGVAN